MLEKLKQCFQKTVDRIETIKTERFSKHKTDLLDDIALRVLRLRTVALDEIDLEELEEALAILDTLCDINCN